MAIYRGSESTGTATQVFNIDGDKGDITVTNGGDTWTIDAGVVTTTKLGGDITPQGKALLDDATAAAQRTTLGLGSAAITEASAYATAAQGIKADNAIPTSQIGVSVQAFDAQLNDVAALTPTDNGVIIGNGTNFVVESGATLKTSLGLTIGTNVQAYSANLDEYASVNPTPAGLALLDDVDASAQRTTLGLGTLATQSGTFSGTSSGTNTGDQNLFSTIIVSGQSNVVADSASDSLTLEAGTGVSLTTNSTTDTVTITNNDLGSSQSIFKNIAVAGQSTVVADSNNDTLTLVGGANVTITTNATTDTITISSAGSGGGSLVADGDYGDVTVSSSGTVWNIDNGAVTLAKTTGVASSGANSNITSLSGLSGNLGFTGTGNRITGDFSNATVANRVAFQSSTTNGSSSLSLLPNGTGLNSFFRTYGNSDPTNASEMAIGTIGTTEVRFQSGITGTGTYLPMTFYTGGSEKVRIDTSGNVGIGAVPSGFKLTVSDGTTNFVTNPTSGIGYIGTSSNHPVSLITNNAERMVISASGNVGIGKAPTTLLDVNGTVTATGWAGGGIVTTGAANTFTAQQTFKELKDTVHTITDAAGFSIDPANGSIQTITLGANRTPVATNFEAGQCVLLGIDDGTAFSITWTSVPVTWVKAGGTASAPTLATTGFTWVLLWEVGTTIYGVEVGKP